MLGVATKPLTYTVFYFTDSSPLEKYFFLDRTGIRINLYRLSKPFNYTRSKPPNYTTETRKLYNCMKPFSYTSVKTTKLHTKTTKLYKIAVQNPEAIQLKPQNYTK